MKTLWRTIQGATTYASDAQTVSIKLPLTGVLHTLYLSLLMTNGSTSCKNKSIDDVVSKIEIIGNGSDVLVSLTPQEIAREHYRRTGKFISEYRDEYLSVVQRQLLPIYFGRYWNDSEYWLPSNSFTDLELRVTYAPTIAATSFATGTFSLQVVGYYTMEGTPGAYRGTLTMKTVKAFTSTASGDEPTLLPRGNPYSGILVYAYEAGTDPFASITDVQLYTNNGETIIVNEKWQTLMERNAEEYWLNDEYHYRAFNVDTDTINTKLAPVKSVMVANNKARTGANGPVFSACVTAIAGDALTLERTSIVDTAGTNGVVTDGALGRNDVLIKCVGIPNCVWIDTSPFGLESALNSKLYDEVKLILTNGNAGAAVRIALQELRAF